MKTSTDIIWAIAILVGLFGAVGGLVKCFLADGFKKPSTDPDGTVWRPGWYAHIIVGSVAALVTWGLYGPLASYDILNPDPTRPLSFKLGELVGAITVGLAGGQILASIAEKNADKITRDNLIKTIKAITDNQTGEPHE
ncbi:hypothetical protein [Opitutus sp. GAS368]|jgi:hypothetical protein|uniref:hypothetical protein n=1 Tax=Opitutus sp. GAS368 TaxID=1882749 RepID=UPI00087B7420|nr:hypothetical protein [Opitutus sp. GAS368]SDS32223.1 hypothetical protein SAMN05444173_2542 [Opitutus sp. GAS368]